MVESFDSQDDEIHPYFKSELYLKLKQEFENSNRKNVILKIKGFDKLINKLKTAGHTPEKIVHYNAEYQYDQDSYRYY